MSLPAKNTSADALRKLLKTNKVRHAGAIWRGGASGPPQRTGIGLTLSNGTHLRVTDKTFTDVIGPIVETANDHSIRDEAPIFVHGPRGCGKTRNARWIAETFGRDMADIVDGWTPGDPIRGGDVYLCIEPPRQEDAPRAVIVPFDRLGQAQDIAVPPVSPFTCGTHHVQAQAVLSLLETGLRIGNQIDSEAIELLDRMVDIAGLNFALRLLRRPVTDDEVPF
ncbi:hypothetical protein [Sphingopyxis sp. SCN 67-31]|uniref:hypothetical protein n=1 Tax=Sphingopyxis sp. SCN 67-31 TaxID=1660142 RepID=UPI00086914ED|nr:hypothetical protein [Sphingopyxis sp. SCN 67-31]ODU36615.1 MAG: hypothetical protein ABS88_00040 [Sphingopyxis sp. SCN 67-31]